MEPAARFVILIALVVLGAALADLVLRDRRLAELGPPRWNGERVESHAVELLPIRDFTYYYGGQDDAWRNLNPFVPYSERRAEREHLESDRPRQNTDDSDVIAAVDPRLNEVEIEIPELDLPALADTQRIQIPEVMGRMGMRGRTYLLVQYDNKTWRMSPGERLGTWTLERVEQGEAVFLDEHGEVWRVRIGRHDDPLVNRLGDHVGEAAVGSASGGEDASVDELIERIMAARDDPAELQRLLADPETRKRLQADPRVRELMKTPAFQQMLERRAQR